MIWQLWQWYIHIHSKYNADVYIIHLHIDIYGISIIRYSHRCIPAASEGRCSTQQNVASPKGCWWCMVHQEANLLKKKNVIFQLVPFFPSFFRRPYFFVYIYIYYVWIQIDRLRLMYKIYINIMSGDNKLWAWRKYHDPTKKGEASDSVRLLSFGHLKNPILQLMDFSPPNSFPETWNQSQQKHRFGKNLFICDCEPLSCSYLFRKGGDISKTRTWWKHRTKIIIKAALSLGPIQLGITSTPPGISFAFMTLFSPFWGCHMPHALECLRVTGFSPLIWSFLIS